MSEHSTDLLLKQKIQCKLPKPKPLSTEFTTNTLLQIEVQTSSQKHKLSTQLLCLYWVLAFFLTLLILFLIGDHSDLLGVVITLMMVLTACSIVLIGKIGGFRFSEVFMQTIATRTDR